MASKPVRQAPDVEAVVLARGGHGATAALQHTFPVHCQPVCGGGAIEQPTYLLPLTIFMVLLSLLFITSTVESGLGESALVSNSCAIEFLLHKI